MTITLVVPVNVQPQDFFEEAIRDHVDLLATIVRHYQINWNDRLSEDLKKWSKELFKTTKDQNLSFEDKKSIGQKKIEELAGIILINPLNPKQMLEDPVLERDWVWEKEIHTNYMNSFSHSKSPFDDKPMSHHPISHDFAKSMIKWLKFFEVKKVNVEEKNEEENQLMPFVPNKRMDAMTRVAIKMLANLAVSKRKHEDMRTAMVKASLEREENIKQVRLLHEEELEASRANAAAHEERNRENLEAVRESMQNKIRHLEEQMARQEEMHLSEMEAFEKHMDSQDQANSQAAEAMKAQLKKMDIDHKQKIDLIKNEIGGFNQQLAEAIQKFDSALQLNEESARVQSQTIESQSSQVQNLYERVSSLHSDLAAKELQVQQLEHSQFVLNHRIHEANNRLNNMPSKRGGCAIM